MRAASSLKNSALVTPRTLFIIIKPYYINREKKRERGDKTVKGRQKRKSPMRCETKAKGEGAWAYGRTGCVFFYKYRAFG